MPNYALERSVRGSSERAAGARRFYACGALERFRAARSTRTLDGMRYVRSGLGILAALIVAQSAVAQLTVPTEAADASKYYPWIDGISIGPVAEVSFEDGIHQEELPFEVVRGQFFRIVVTSAEEARSHYLERITFGGEGCCMQLASAMRLETIGITKQLNLPSNTSFIPVRWISPTSYTFEAQSRHVEMRNLDASQPSVVEINE